VTAGGDIPVRALDVRARRIDGHVHVARDPRAVELSDVAGAIWRLADGKRTVDDIAEALSAEYDVGREDAHADVLEFVERMASLELMHWRRP
jgi:hypothetical protein